MRPSRSNSALFVLLFTLATTGLWSAFAAPPGYAACTFLPGHEPTKHQRLVNAANDADVVFVGTVVKRKPISQAGEVREVLLTFRVAVFLHGKASRTVQLTAAADLRDGAEVIIEDSVSYRGAGLMLAAADRSGGRLHTVDGCGNEVGPVSARRVRALLTVADNPVIYDQRFAPATPVDAPTLPFTGPADLWLLVVVALALILSGAGLMTTRKRVLKGRTAERSAHN